MKNGKSLPLAVFASIAFLILLTAWNQDNIVYPTLYNLDQFEISKEKPSGEIDVLPYSSVSYDLDDLGYTKTIYTKMRSSVARKESVLVASSIVNENAFGKGRTFEDFHATIASLDYPKEQMSLAIYCGSSMLLKSVLNFFDNVTKSESYAYNRVTVIYAPFLQTTFERSDHSASVQRPRRRSIARGRNFVVSCALQDENNILFLDADIVSFNHPVMLTKFVESSKDIIVPRVEKGNNNDYDRNSWRGSRNSPSDSQIMLMDEDKWEEANFEPTDVSGAIYHLANHVEEIQGLPENDEKVDLGYTVSLDSVGGAVLFFKSIIFRQGVVFPTMNIVGTAWSRKEGFDGIETEGLCYLAQTLNYFCYAMPNLVAQHYA